MDTEMVVDHHLDGLFDTDEHAREFLAILARANHYRPAAEIEPQGAQRDRDIDIEAVARFLDKVT